MKRVDVEPPGGEVRMARIERRVLEAAAKLPAPVQPARTPRRAAGASRRHTALAFAVGALACACAVIGWTLASRVMQRRAQVAHFAAEQRTADAVQAQAFKLAEEQEASDPGAALEAYRKVARGTGPWAARALYNVAKLETAYGHPELGIATADDYLRRFPAGAHVEAVSWMRAELFAATGWDSYAAAAARHYLERFPTGAHAEAAQAKVQSSASR